MPSLRLVSFVAALQLCSSSSLHAKCIGEFSNYAGGPNGGAAAKKAVPRPVPPPVTLPPRASFGPRPVDVKDTAEVAELGDDFVGPADLRKIIKTLQARASKNDNASTFYLLGRALVLDTTAGVGFSKVVLNRLPAPKFGVTMTEQDRHRLAEARQALVRAKALLGSGRSNLAFRTALTLAWVTELEAQLPDAPSDAPAAAVGAYLSIAEKFDRLQRDDPIFLEAMADAESGYQALSTFQRLRAWGLGDRIDALREHSAESKEALAAAEQAQHCTRTPLLISLNGSTDPASFSDDRAAVHFRLDPFLTNSTWSWVTPLAALLVWDSARAGKITSGAQLFGQETWLMEPTDGFAALSLLDQDSDGWLEGHELQGIRVWIDADGDGRSAASEVRDLSSLGVDRLATEGATRRGRHTLNPSGVHLTSGSTLPLVDWVAQEADPLVATAASAPAAGEAAPWAPAAASPSRSRARRPR